MLVFSIYAKIHAVTIYKSLIWNGIFSLPRALISSNFELTKIIEAINKQFSRFIEPKWTHWTEEQSDHEERDNWPN